ncbi:unnamed protein product [Caenorhabditis angaria]|uniref:PDZ domain-containing protein n=1 Tax=Caenorhabditis angaria TaxID=860376 RepID=A0A9P1I4M7_9PELO|nr:unnamed protein product [Caenorhabditis angaria]
MESVHRLTSAFNRAMNDAIMAEEKVDMMTNIKSMSILFTEMCANVEKCEAEKMRFKKEAEQNFEKYQELQAKADGYDDVVEQLHIALLAKSDQKFASPIFDKIRHEVHENLQKIDNYHRILANYQLEIERNKRMEKYIDELSKCTVLQRIGSRFFAREVAAVRQMLNLVQNSPNVDHATKSRVWDEIEAENNVLRQNTLWLINRINGDDTDNDLMPRVVVLMRSHAHQGLGLEITGGCDTFRPVLITAKLKGSMADDDELRIGDRIIAIDGTFLNLTSRHSDVMKMLETESAKDYLALVVSAFNPFTDDIVSNQLTVVERTV